MRRLARILTASLTSVAILCEIGLPATADATGTLAIAQPQDPGSLDPIDTFIVNWASIGTNVFEGLVQRGPDLKLTPGLATKWTELDGGKRIRFELRRNVIFQDGEPFDANAVKFTFDRLLGPDGAKGPQRYNYTAIDKVEIVDPHTVDFILKNYDPVLLTKLAGYGACIVPPRYLAEKGKVYFATHPIGTGPFKVVDYQPKVGITLGAFPSYWGEKPLLDKVVFRFIAEPATQVAELQAGRVDIVAPLPVNLIPLVQKYPRLSVLSVTGPYVVTLRFNTKSGITANETVRKALIMAVDRDAIIKTLLLGYGNPAASFQSQLSFGYDPSLRPLPFDPEKAKTMLQEAGIKHDDSVEIDFPGGDSTIREAMQAVAGYLQAVGIAVSVKSYDPNVYLSDVVPHGKTGALFEQGSGGWTFDYDNTAYLFYHTGENWNPYDSDPILDKMLEAQRYTKDRTERLKILWNIAHYVADHAIEMPLYNVDTVYGVAKRVHGFEPPADRRLSLLHVSVQ
jgi:peptide/nickel transport system substrate-binding protein